MKHKSYFWILVLVVGAVVLFNFSTWLLATRTILSGNPLVGDLARMGYLPEIVNLNKGDGAPGGKHLNYWEYDGQEIEFVTLGDSFSQGGGETFYQDWLAAASGKTVLNLNEIFWYPKLRNRLDPVANLLNDGFFDQIKPKYLVIQNVERLSETLIEAPEWETVERATQYRNFLEERKDKTRVDKIEKKGFLNTAAFKYCASVISYYFRGSDYSKTVYSNSLSKDLFTGETPNKVAYFYQDLEWARKSSADKAIKINDNINHLTRLLREKGIELIFLPSVDKYDLYRDFMVDCDHEKSVLFESLRDLPKDYIYVDSKRILGRLLLEGEKDVYWQDDTHWSWKASREIARSIVAQISNQDR